MQRVTSQFIDKVKAGPNQIQIADTLTRLTYLVLSDSLFSDDLDENSDKVLANVAYFLKHLGRPDPVGFFGAPDWVPRLTKLRGTGAISRLRAAVPDTAQQRLQLQDHAIKGGSHIIANPWVLHRHRALWERPDEFHPERFFGENRDRIDRFAICPSGLENGSVLARASPCRKRKSSWPC